MIAIEGWSRVIALGSMGVVTFTLDSVRRVVRLEVDLLGDGVAAPTIVTGDDLRLVVALAFTPEKAGTYSVQVRAVDEAGCEGATGLRRDVVIH